MQAETGVAQVGQFRVLLPGVPCRTNRGWLGYCSVVLFPLGDEWGLFDTGHYSDRAQLLAALDWVGLQPGDIRWLVLSHLHFDHMLNLGLFKEATVVVARAEMDYAREVSAGQRHDPALPEFWDRLVHGRRLQVVEDSGELGPYELSTHGGHTPGGLVLSSADQGVVVCGDVLKNAVEAITTRPSAAAVDAAQAEASIRAVLAKGGTFIPGHDRPFRFGGRRVDYLEGWKLELRGTLEPNQVDRVVAEVVLPPGPLS